ncbi:MAG: hypothetical protein M0R17_04100 [Candidatus Omnitrophica bacterium]|jgi:hypothetical protein|nr:hypothetical protein [Candidatus Omnitrophota bacterium]
MERVCTKCNKIKDLSEFALEHRNNIQYYRKVCKECRNAARKNKVYISNLPKFKECSICHKTKLLNEFNKSYVGKFGYDNRCADCKHQQLRKTNEKPRYDKLIKINNELYKKCVKCKQILPITKYTSNILTRDHLTSSCIDCASRYRALDSSLKKRRDHKRLRMKNDETYRLRCNISASIVHYLKGERKYSNSVSLLGIKDIKEYKKYLETQFNGTDFNWDNYGTIWQIDHIIPITLFKLNISEHQIVAFNYLNTRPLSKFDNLSRPKYYITQNDINIVLGRGLIIPNDILEYLKTKINQ